MSSITALVNQAASDIVGQMSDDDRAGFRDNKRTWRTNISDMLVGEWAALVDHEDDLIERVSQFVADDIRA